jgi:hypothetical protein
MFFIIEIRINIFNAINYFKFSQRQENLRIFPVNSSCLYIVNKFLSFDIRNFSNKIILNVGNKPKVAKEYVNLINRISLKRASMSEYLNI